MSPTVSWTIPNRPKAPASYLLKQDYEFLLLQDGGKIILAEIGWVDRTAITSDWVN